jgi:hypothetical protein
MTHAQRRAIERYGLYLRAADFRFIREQIRDGLALKLKKLRGRRGIYLVNVQDDSIVVIYDRRTARTITVLPIDTRGIKG